MLVTLHRRFDLAAPWPTSARDRQGSASLPQRRGWLPGWLRRSFSARSRASFVGSRDLAGSFRGLAGTYPMRLPVDPRMPSQRRALDALAHINAAVQATHSIGEGAPNNGARGSTERRP